MINFSLKSILDSSLIWDQLAICGKNRWRTLALGAGEQRTQEVGYRFWWMMLNLSFSGLYHILDQKATTKIIEQRSTINRTWHATIGFDQRTTPTSCSRTQHSRPTSQDGSGAHFECKWINLHPWSKKTCFMQLGLQRLSSMLRLQQLTRCHWLWVESHALRPALDSVSVDGCITLALSLWLHKASRQLFAKCWHLSWIATPPFGSAHIKVTIVATFARPKGHYKRGGEGELRVSAPRTPIGDVDNLLKFVLDALNKVLFDDDKQVVYAAVSKEYVSVSRTYIQIERVD